MPGTQTATERPVTSTAGSGGSGSLKSDRKKEVICIADAHMHIQSGHVGTLPFALGAVIPFSNNDTWQPAGGIYT